MNAQFTNVHDRLDRIEEQTKKTNGRVTELEHKELTHIQNCPNVEKIQKINEDLVEYKMLKKYPKIGLTLLAAAIILFLITTFDSIDKLKKAATPYNIEVLKETGKTLNDSLELYKRPPMY